VPTDLFDDCFDDSVQLQLAPATCCTNAYITDLQRCITEPIVDLFGVSTAPARADDYVSTTTG
jgi:hypothetical protein